MVDIAKMDDLMIRNYRAFAYLQKKRPTQFIGAWKGRVFTAYEVYKKTFAGFSLPGYKVLFQYANPKLGDIRDLNNANT